MNIRAWWFVASLAAGTAPNLVAQSPDAAPGDSGVQTSAARPCSAPRSGGDRDAMLDSISRATLFVAPTGYLIPRCAFDLQVNSFLLVSVDRGITNRLTVGGGVFLISLGHRPATTEANVKLGLIDAPLLHVAAGALVAVAPFSASPFSGGGYASATVGTPEFALTAAAAEGVSQLGVNRAPVFMVGAKAGPTPSVGIFVETYFGATSNGMQRAALVGIAFRRRRAPTVERIARITGPQLPAHWSRDIPIEALLFLPPGG